MLYVAVDEGVVTVALIDEPTENLMIAEGVTLVALALELDDDGISVTTDTKLDEEDQIVAALVTGEGGVDLDPGRKLPIDELKEVVMS